MGQQTNELHIVPREKDQTDLEIAINWALEQKPALIRIFGATGGRLRSRFGKYTDAFKRVRSRDRNVYCGQ